MQVKQVKHDGSFSWYRIFTFTFYLKEQTRKNCFVTIWLIVKFVWFFLSPINKSYNSFERGKKIVSVYAYVYIPHSSSHWVCMSLQIYSRLQRNRYVYMCMWSAREIDDGNRRNTNQFQCENCIFVCFDGKLFHSSSFSLLMQLESISFLVGPNTNVYIYFACKHNLHSFLPFNGCLRGVKYISYVL